MKLLLIDSRLDGHHITYLNALIEAGIDNKFEVSIALPSADRRFAEDIIIYELKSCNGHKLGYAKFILEINSIIKKAKPDIVHFLFADALFRYFAFGLKHKHIKTIVTCHQIRRSLLRDLSYRMFGKKVDAVVVHTEKLKIDFNRLNIKNTYHIEYPRFYEHPNMISCKYARDWLRLPICNEKVLLAIGGTRFDKGLDILLAALKNVTKPFHLIIAGKEEGFTRGFIEEQIKSYRKNVTLFLGYLSDEKFHMCMAAADIIVLPYKQSFDGASGPLGEGVWCFKEIIGSNHKSLGEIINNNHLGKTFECENIESLSQVLNLVLDKEWIPDEKYQSYRNSIDKRVFQRMYVELYKRMID